MIPSNHALERWGQRFPWLDMKKKFMEARHRLTPQEFGILKSRAVNEKTKSRIHSKMFKGVYYRRTDDGICFVIAPGEVVVTAFVIDMKRFSRVHKPWNLVAYYNSMRKVG